ncbi:cytochrome P450 CYP82D47-like [Cucumis melo var. makuwa]|uniref:Cytochrome P450 CYP82D47-like n=1 Tax=Cucumis melo var. makuwa TaxID=1194695 RepID=A0A5A7TQR9_CUCMM|nr:cytochrome P450 CYP82D47-like [Cucumis melo var. makuwa]
MMNNYYLKADQATMNNIDESRTTSLFSSGFWKIDDLFLEFDDAFNITGGSSLVVDPSGYISTPKTWSWRDTNTISVLMRDTFPVRCLKWADVPPKYIEVVKGGLQQSRTNKAVRTKQLYNHSSGSKLSYNDNTSSLNNEAVVDVHKALNPSLGTRYVRPFWVDDLATQKVLVEALSPSPEKLVEVLCLHTSKRCTPKRLVN